MVVAVTGGTGFIGSHLVESLVAADRDVRVLARGRTPRLDRFDRDTRVRYHAVDLTTVDRLTPIFDGCEAVAHLAGINHERGRQTYDRVHREATDAVVTAAEQADVDRLVLTSYLRARPDCGSGYLESKWTAEELVRAADLGSVVLKPAGVFGPRDQFLTGLVRWARTVPVLPTVGLTDRELRPVAVEDVVRVIETGLTGDHLAGTTLPLMGPTTVTMRTLANRVGDVAGARPLVVPAPVVSQRVAGAVFERLLDPPLVTQAGVRMLAEGMTTPEPASVCDPVPDDLRPEIDLDREAIERAAGDRPRYGLSDLRYP